MFKKIFLILICLIAIFLISKKLYAETPCSHVGQERLEDFRQCLQAGGSSGNLDPDHRELLNSLAAAQITSPHPHPYVPDTSLLTYAIVANNLRYGHGYRYTYLMYPYSMYLANPPFYPY